MAPVPVPDNALLAEWTGAYGGVPPWDQVKLDLFPQAFQFGIDEQRREMLTIGDSTAPPTFANTIEAMERGGQRLDRVQTLFGVINQNLSTPKCRPRQGRSPSLPRRTTEITLKPAVVPAGPGDYDARESAVGRQPTGLVTRLLR